MRGFLQSAEGRRKILPGRTDHMAICPVCFHHCDLTEGAYGLCMARRCHEGRVKCDNYGKITSLALDPIEKKPFAEFMPGSMILSAGSYGCNLRCPFCQNHSISYDEEVADLSIAHEEWTPEELADAAAGLIPRGNIGIAFTYNEPLVGFEFVLDTSKLVKERGMETVLVTNGTAEPDILEEILPYISAMNIDLKAFSDSFYTDLVKGDRHMVMDFIDRAASDCHVEVTTLIIPGENDSEEEMASLAEWLSGIERKRGRRIPLHITRFFPRFRMTDKEPTDPALVRRLGEIAGRTLESVYLGNM